MAIRKILIVEDQALARAYLCSCVEKCTDCEVAGTLTRADAATPRVGRRFSDCKPLFLVKIMTVTKEKAPANYVPAAAVIRREQALSGFTGCKGCVGG